jgi:hypothetical protein
MQIAGDNPPPGMVGDGYYTAFTADGGAAPFRWTITGDS